MDLILLLYGYSLGFTLLTLNMDVFNQNTLISTTLFCDHLHFGLFSSATNVIHPIRFCKKKVYHNTTACLWEGCSLDKHHDAKTVQLCSAGSVFGSIEFLSKTGGHWNRPEDWRVE